MEQSGLFSYISFKQVSMVNHSRRAPAPNFDKKGTSFTKTACVYLHPKQITMSEFLPPSLKLLAREVFELLSVRKETVSVM